MTAFPTEKKFRLLARICPNNRKTGGRIRSRRFPKGQEPSCHGTANAAQTLHKSDSALGS